MEREQDGGSELSKHISMELLGNGARVTNLKLENGKLILTVEADIADSHLAADQPAGHVQPAPAPIIPEPVAPPPAPAPAIAPAPVAPVPLSPAPSSAGGIPMPSLGAPLVEESVNSGPGLFMETPPVGGSDMLRPQVEAPAPQPGTISLGGDFALEPEAVEPPPISLESALPPSPSQRVATQPPLPTPGISLEGGPAFQAPPPAPVPAPVPAPAPAPAPHEAAGISIGSDTELGLKPFKIDTAEPAFEPEPQAAPAPTPVPAPMIDPGFPASPSEPDKTWDMSQMGTPPAAAPVPESDPLTMPTVAFTNPPQAEQAPAAPGPALSLGGDAGWNNAPGISLGAPSDGMKEIKLGNDPLPVAPAPAAPEMVPPSAAPGKEISLGGEISLGDDLAGGDWGLDGGLNLSTSEPPQPLMETWDPSSLALGGAGNDPSPMTLSDDSSALGGPRHGEPQPAISFGLGGEPAAAPSLAPAPGAPISLGEPPAAMPPPREAPSLSIATPPSLTPEVPAPAPSLSVQPPVGAPISLGAPTPAQEPGFAAAPLSLDPPAPQTPPAPAPGLSLDVPGISLGAPAVPEAGPSLLSPEPQAPAPQPPPPAPAPAVDPMGGFGGLSFDAPAAAPEPPAPAPEAASPAAAAPAPQTTPGGEKKSPEAGGTTVLIRYTCPKCKTQGMQAVDKVGTVVNCSNCGKAMRLVMKK